ncbi:DUF3619 family protein [Ideonella paludis]|uniref:DUF3619 family protein n=1 Tax=Ideonella paludis TaxID=1233411 RepID=UPI00287392E2|nr:DUF3619 family protein [Ideonella paludis]
MKTKPTLPLSGHTRLDGHDGVEARVGLRIAALLTERSASTDHAINERLRVAREQALARARARRLQEQAAQGISTLGGSLALRGGPTGSSWLQRMGFVLPLVVLLLGMFAIDEWHEAAQIQAAVEVDSALLSDPLPPDAYRDPGFLEFLKAPPVETSDVQISEVTE